MGILYLVEVNPLYVKRFKKIKEKPETVIVQHINLYFTDLEEDEEVI